MSDPLVFVVTEAQSDVRVDVFLASCDDAFTRSSVAQWIKDGSVQINGRACKPSQKLSYGDQVCLTLPELRPSALVPEDIPLDIVYEDSDIIVINKPRGMVVHPAAGNETGTLVHALLHHCTDLSGIGGEERPGIVHRIDKDTTGLLVVAKNDAAHHHLQAQIQAKTCHRIYWALAEGRFSESGGVVDAPIARHPVDRKKMAVVQGGRSAVTHWQVVQSYARTTLVECRLETGRTHQIRVHMAHIGHPLVGDPVYGFKRQHIHAEGQLLHARELILTHPRTGDVMHFRAELPDDFARILQKLT